MTEQENIRAKAFKRWWWLKYAFHEADRYVAFFLDVPSARLGQLRAARLALHLPGDLPGFTRQRFHNLERTEERGSISLNSLARAANALDCDLVYAIRPKSKMTYSKVLWNKVLPKALESHWYVSRPAGKKHLALVYLIDVQMNSPKVKRVKGWTKRRTGQKPQA